MFRKNQKEERRNARNARKMNGNALATLKKVASGVRNEIAADTLAFAAGMGSAAIINSSVCGIVNGAARGYYDAAGVELVVKKHRWSTPQRVNSKALGRKKVYSAQPQGWWFNPTTTKKMTDAVATASVICGAVAGTTTRGIVKDALNYHESQQDSSESWDSYYEEDAAEE